MKPGTYYATVMDYGLTKSKTGTPMVVVRFDLEGSGESINAYWSFSEKAAEYTLKNLRVCGFNGDSFAALNSLDCGLALSSAKIEIKDEDGKMRVGRIFPIQKLVRDPECEEIVKGFDHLLKSTEQEPF